MKDLKKIKDALKTLQSIHGVEGCFLEAEVGDILHVYTITRRARYDLDKRIFQEYAELEKRFPQVSFEFLVTSQPPSPVAEVVFSHDRAGAPPTGSPERRTR